MPYPNEHAARLTSPKKYIRIRRQNDKFGSSIDAIFGVLQNGKTELQSIRFDKKKYTPAQARKWLADHDFKPIGFEEATGGKEISMDDEQEQKDVYTSYGEQTISYFLPDGITSFAELDAAQEAREMIAGVRERTQQFHQLVDNIMSSDEVVDKAKAIESLVSEFTTRVSSTMRKEVDMIERHLLTNVQISILGRMMDAVKGWFETGQESEAKPSFMLWKEADGQYHWLARYSNNFRDEDHPPEIISEASHRRFVDLVDKGLVPLPELWLWHQPEWKIGKANWIAWDDAGFALASGTIDEDKKSIASWLEQADLCVSHGMSTKTIARDESDNTIIVHHITREISPLPRWAAANKLTAFEILTAPEIQKGNDTMTIPDSKRSALLDMGITTEQLAALEAANVGEAGKAIEQGLESKETDVKTEAEADEAATETKPEPDEKAITREEIVSAIELVLEPLQKQIADLTKELAELKRTDTERIKEAATLTPAASLVDMLRGRAVGNTGAQIDGRTALAKAGPAETEAKAGQEGPSFIPFINSLIMPQSKS